MSNDPVTINAGGSTAGNSRTAPPQQPTAGTDPQPADSGNTKPQENTTSVDTNKNAAEQKNTPEKSTPPQTGARVQIPPELQEKTQQHTTAARQETSPNNLREGNTVRLSPITPAQAQRITDAFIARMRSIAYAIKIPPATQAFQTNSTNAQTAIQVQKLFTQGWNPNNLLQNTSQNPQNINNINTGKGSMPPLSFSGNTTGQINTTLQILSTANTLEGIQPQNTKSILLSETVQKQGTTPFGTRNAISDINATITKIDNSLHILPGSNTTPASLLANGISSTTTTATTVTAQITAITPGNLPLLSMLSPDGKLSQNFIMQFNAGNLPPGTRIQISNITPSTGSISSTQAAGSSTGFLLPSSEIPESWSWPNMEEILQTVMAGSALNRSMNIPGIFPSPANPSHFASSALFFIAAIRAGDMQNWLGEKTLNTLKASGKTAAIEKLASDVSVINRMMSEGTDQPRTPATDWKSMIIPMAWNNEVQKLVIHYRQNREHNDNSDDTPLQTRFVFDLNLNRMGNVQLDGLVRKKRMDMILRTQKPFSQRVRQRIRQLYTKAINDTGLYGEIDFQTNASKWVKPHPSPKNIKVKI